ncbi:hypothetical protein RR48_08121 [Papilio machaon]|uniref:Uncharacterized protein n=1 Tax=Papilio machaon TaxID=76193 RepID=A0A194RGS7_PAPMA|nr:hypothetical protein RR48_08121 [Papilio machaon]
MPGTVVILNVGRVRKNEKSYVMCAVWYTVTYHLLAEHSLILMLLPSTSINRQTSTAFYEALNIKDTLISVKNSVYPSRTSRYLFCGVVARSFGNKEARLAQHNCGNRLPRRPVADWRSNARCTLGASIVYVHTLQPGRDTLCASTRQPQAQQSRPDT